MNIKEQLLQGNKQFLKDVKSSKDKSLRLEELHKGQKPYALVICCSNSRVVPEQIFNTYFGELFVIRTAGNVINEGELGSIEYGIEHLNIKYVLVLGHTSCGAVHAAMHNEKGKYLDPILNRIKSSILEEKDERQASIINAKEVASYLRKMFPEYDGNIDYGLYDINTNEVTIW